MKLEQLHKNDTGLCLYVAGGWQIYLHQVCIVDIPHTISHYQMVELFRLSFGQIQITGKMNPEIHFLGDNFAVHKIPPATRRQVNLTWSEFVERCIKHYQQTDDFGE